ncbi:MAG: hypothetical protein ACRC1P_09940 [Cellulosilyticaceae bacterium]
MTKIGRKTIYFKEEYAEEYVYINKMKNASEYICELIKKDRLENDTPIAWAKQVEELLMKIESSRNKK